MWYLHDIGALIWIRKYRWLIAISSYAHLINKISIAELLVNFNSFLFIFIKNLLIYNNSVIQICSAAPIRRNPTRKKIKRNRCFHSQHLSENERPVSFISLISYFYFTIRIFSPGRTSCEVRLFVCIRVSIET